jgi:hypothetical protein
MNKEILKQIIRDAYDAGDSDGHAKLYNDEYVGSDKTKLIEVDGIEKTVENLLKDYLFLNEDDLTKSSQNLDINDINVYDVIDRRAVELASYVEFQNRKGECKILKQR